MSNTFFIKTTSEWDSTSMNSYIIPRGDLCIEAFDDGDMKLKIGDGSRVFKQLPYICHCHDEDYYTKEEIDEMIDDIKIDLNDYYNKTEIDKLLSSLKEELIKYINDHTHSHDNKDILDQITAPFTIEEKEKIKDIIDVSGYDKRIKALEADSHTHDNKDILDSITTEDVDSWHTHTNKSVLDNTNASFTVNYKNILDNMKTYKVFEPASPYESGSVGLVPAPNRGDNTKFLRGDGKWVYVEGGSGGQLEPATRTTLGGVIIGNGINVDANGLISIEEIEPYELPVATANILGGVKIGNNIDIDDGVISVTFPDIPEPYELPKATSSILGGVKIGNNIDVNDGVISVTFPDIPEPYILPKATSNTLGGVIVGNNIDVNDGVISVTFPTDAETVNGHTVEIDVPADAKFTDTIGVLSVTQNQSNLNELIVEYEDHSDQLVIPDTKYYEGTAIDIVTGEDPSVNERRIRYIEFPAQYQNCIKLNYSPIGSTNVELECEIYPNSNNYWGLFGARRDMSGYAIESFQLGMGHNDRFFWWGRGDSLQTADSTIAGFRTARSDQLVNTHLLIKTNGSTITVTNLITGEVLINEDHPLPFTASNYNMNLFSIARKDLDGYSDPIAGKIYSFKIYEGTTLVRNYVPVEHNRYGIVLHEMIGNTYHAPNSSSNVHAGPYLDPTPYSNSINVLYSTGLSVNADNELINTGVLDIQESTNPLEIVKVKSDTTEAVGITLPIAASDTLGGVKVGNGLSIDNTGVLSANIQENGVLDVSVNLEDPYKLDITFSDHTKSIKLPDPLDVGVIDVRAQQDETVAVLEVEKTSGVSEIDLIALLQGLTINVNFSDDGSVINRAIINKHAYERINVTEIITSDNVIENKHVSERANLTLTTNNVITNIHAVIPDES